MSLREDTLDLSRACEASIQQKRIWSRRDRAAATRTVVAVRLANTDQVALRAALTNAAADHEILRTTFATTTGLRYPHQLVLDAGEVGWRELAGRSLEDVWAEELVATEPLRATLLTDDRVLVLSAPSLCCDVQSLAVLVLHRDGHEPLQYGDFAGWQQSWIDDLPAPVRQRAVETAPPPLHAPVGTAAGPRAGVVSFTVDAYSTNPESFVLACWVVLLHRLSGDGTVRVDRIDAGRTLDDLRDAVGVFEVPVPTTCELGPATVFSALLADVAGQAGDIDDRLANLNAELARGDVTGAPTAVRFLAAPVLLATDHGYPLALTCVEADDRWSMAIQYDRKRFADDAVRGLGRQLATVIRDAASRPDATVVELAILDETERQRALDFVPTEVSTVPVETVHEAFRAAARRWPERPAVEYEGRVLTFAELDAESDRLATRLAELGARPDSVIGLPIGRSAEMLVGVLGILKSGGAYLPIDPSDPPERQRSMLRDAGAIAVVGTDETPVDGMPPVIPVDAAGCAATPESSGPHNLAYVITTSGTTGRPKGVAVPHRAVAHLRAGLRALVYYKLGGPLRVSVNGPLSFDTSVKQIVQLLDGHTVLPIPESLRLEPQLLIDYLVRHRIEVSDCTPSQLAMWLDAGLLTASGSVLRAVLVGGEAIPPEMWRRLATSSVTAFNMYGPTECTVDVTVCRIEGSTPSLGRPLPNVRVLLLDDKSRPVPPGTVGEICVSGPTLANGYLGDPAATARSFVANPFPAAGHERLYRTGDLGRHREDGSLEYRGRVDRQVKVRGFRVEPGEIEAALTEHPSVGGAVVVAAGGQLAAYWTPLAAVDTEDLWEFLVARLPAHLVPSSLTRIDRIPLTTNGKVDVAALPEPTARVVAPGAAPRTPLEQELAGVWSQVLGVDAIGRDDNFFTLGGDSIMCVQATALARRRGLTLSPLQVVRHPTIAALAAVVESATPTTPKPAAAVSTTDVPLTPIHRRFAARDLADANHWNQAVWLSGAVDVDALRRAVDQLVTHHDALRLRMRREGDTWRQEIAPAETADLLSSRDLSALSDDEFEAEASRLAAETQRRLDIANGPLLRALHLHGARADRLLLVAHHIAVDGVSWRILLEDLEVLLAGGSLPAKTTPYQRWAQLLAEHARSPQVADELAYWRQQRRRDELPRDFADGANLVAQAEEILSIVDADLSTALVHDVTRAYGATVQEVLLAALWTAVRGWSGSDGIVLDMEGHGRQEHIGDVDLSRTVGWLTTVFPVAFDAPGTTDFASVLAMVQHRLRAVPEAGIGYGLLRYSGAGLDDTAQISFNYLGHVNAGTDGSVLTRIDADTGGERAASAQRNYLFEIDASVVDGQLRLYWTYGRAVHSEQTVRGLIERMLAVVREAVDGVHRQPEAYPLAPVQASMVRRTQTRPRFGQYLYQWVLELREELELELWQRAWDEMIARHDTLRTEIRVGDQLIRPWARAQVKVLDWTDGPHEDEYLTSVQAAGLDLAAPPALDVAVARLGDGRQLVLLTFSLVLLDVTSFATVLDDVWTRYDTLATGQPPQPMPQIRPYREYVDWALAQDVDSARALWQRTMAGLNEIPAGLTGKAVNRGRPRRYTELVHWLTEAETDELRDVTRANGVTVNTVVQQVWAHCVAERTGQRSVVLGAITSGRRIADDDPRPLAGRCVNFMPVRVDVTGPDLAWDEVRRTQERFFDTLQYPAVSNDQIADWCGLPGDVPLFDSLVAWEVEPFQKYLSAPHWARVAQARLVQDPDIPLKLTGTLAGRLRMSLAYLPDEIGPAAAESVFGSVVDRLVRLAGGL